MTEFKVGRRYLVNRSPSSLLSEVLVLEISPTGKHIKFRFNAGSESWISADDYVIVEELITPAKPKVSKKDNDYVNDLLDYIEKAKKRNESKPYYPFDPFHHNKIWMQVDYKGTSIKPSIQDWEVTS